MVSTKPPAKFSFATWNIDGLCERNLRARYQHVAKVIEANKYSVVFLQEVVQETLRYFDQTLENYRQACFYKYKESHHKNHLKIP